MPLDQVTAMSVNFDPAEDRIILDCQLAAGTTVRLWLTRRIARRLVQRLSAWLGHSSPVAARIAQPGLREDVLQMEHRSQRLAVAQQNRDAPTVRADPAPAAPSGRLITGIGFADLTDSRFGVGLILDKGQRPSLEIRFARPQVHWWAGRLDRLAQSAAWDLGQGDRGWLAMDPEPSPQSGPLH